MVSNTTLGLAAVCGTLVLGYCYYFDLKRRRAPDFKKKLREKRRKQNKKGQGMNNIPDLKNQESIQKFFLQEVQLGEELLAQNDVEGGIEHLSNAVAVCGTPTQLLQVLQTTLPPPVFQLLLQRLPAAGQRIAAQAVKPSEGKSAEAVAEDDVE